MLRGATFSRHGLQPPAQCANRLPPGTTTASVKSPVRTRFLALPVQSTLCHHHFCHFSLPVKGTYRTTRFPTLRSATGRPSATTLARSKSDDGSESSKEPEQAIPLGDQVKAICLSVRDLVRGCVKLLSAAFLPVFLIHEICALCTYLVQKISHRALNEGLLQPLLMSATKYRIIQSLASTTELVSAIGFCSVAAKGLAIPESSMGNLWTIIDRPEIMNFETGYQQLSFVFYLLLVPATALLRSLASTATFIICADTMKRNALGDKQADSPAQVATADSAMKTDQTAVGTSGTAEVEAQRPPLKKAETDSKLEPNTAETKFTTDKVDPEPPSPSWWSQMRGSVAEVWRVLPRVREIWLNMWIIELLVTAQVMPLEALSYFVVTLPWTLPRILDLQLAVVSAVRERLFGMDALRRSAELAKGVRWGMLVLLVGTLLAARAIEGLQVACLGQFPARIFREVPELPLLISIAAYVANRIVNRVRDVMPLAVYLLQTKRLESTTEGAEKTAAAL